jgi:hypothetical protein
MRYRRKPAGGTSLRIWIDLDNTPHPSFFRPIVEELRARGHEVTVTARADGQTVELARIYSMAPRVVGRGRGRSFLTKAVVTLWRALRLSAFGMGRGFDLAVSHGSRPLVLAAWPLRVPVLTLYDYEGVAAGLFHRFSDRILVPDPVVDTIPEARRDGVVGYPGAKEEVYLADFQPDPTIRERLGVGEDRVLVLLRPEADAAHYHPRDRQPLLEAVADRLATEPRVQVALVPRSAAQEREVGALLDGRGVSWFVPETVDGRQLVWAADLVIGGGGTMTREAAVLGVPACSVFQGPTGAVDRALEAEGRLRLLRRIDDASGIPLARRPAPPTPEAAGRAVLEFVVDEIYAVGRGGTEVL